MRPTYEGWDDLGNRNRLLDAVGEVGADWVLSLDADERIDEGDAAALRRLVDGEGDPACGYLVEVHRMIGDEHHYDKASLWVGRLFAFRAGQRFAGGRLHLVPLPTDVPPARWRRTTIRVQHLGDLDDERRRAHFAKYQQADPGREHQADYSNLLEAPGVVRPWRPRPPGLPLLFNEQGAPDPVAMAAGPGDDALTPAVGALDAATALHRSGWALVSGPVANATPTPGGWAAYFLEHAHALPGRPPGRLPQPPSWCTVAAEVLAAAPPAPDPAARNRALFRRGYGAYRSPDVGATFASPGGLLRSRARAGRARAGEALAATASDVLLHAPRRLRSIGGAVLRWGSGVRGRFVLVLPLVVAGLIAEAAGLGTELARARWRPAAGHRGGPAPRRRRRAEAGRPRRGRWR